ncbi:hypothetical protein OAA77_00730 [Gammaproteobacteria bacterium]|nr:hypothetical protein [Gammaproteobacteria bacterium]
MQKRILFYAIVCLFSVSALSQTTTTLIQDKPIWDLRLDNATDMSAPDDGTSQVFNLGFDFTFFGETFNQAYMASNGCLIFGTLATGNNWEKNCTQYNPSPEPNTNYTMYPFWTDLIMRDNSDMLAKQFNDKVIFGWYEMWEYDRDSKNTFELWLYPNDSYEARYGELDIQNHDVFIGIQGKEDELETYYFHDKCNTGQYNSKECFNYDWNSSSTNEDLEYDGSIFVGDALDCSNPLNDTSCSGYWDAYDNQQCDLDPQYGPFCQGYKQEDSVAYYEEEPDYGYQEEPEQFGYVEEIEQFGYVEEPMFDQEYDTFEEPEYIYEEEIIFEQMFPQEEYRESFEVTQDFQREEELFMPMEEPMLDEFIFQETFLVEDFTEPETFIELETVEQLEEWFEEETRMEEELAYAEEPEEEFLEEVFEEEAVEEVFEAIEERMAEAEVEEERLEREEVAEEFEETFQEEFQVAERQEASGKSSISREMALRVVSSTITTANQSVSGTTSGTSIHATGGTTGSSGSSSSSSGGGISTSSSPSMSDQIASASVQTNQLLDMTFNSSVDTSASSVAMETETISTSLSVDATTTQTIQNQIDVSVATGSTSSESDKIADKILSQNIQDAQEDVLEKQEQTGEYGSEDVVISYIGFLPGFNAYRIVSIPEKEFWYEPKSIYTSNTISDNTLAFYGLAGQSIKTLTDLRKMQPAL